MYKNLAPRLLADMLILLSQVFKRTKEPALIELLPAEIQLHLHLLQSQQLEQHLLILLHSREEVEGDLSLKRVK